ncbi:MAG: hypothetical protein ACJAYD_000655 [Patiriisocius sp.]|jgi:hypothetical protein
MNLQERIDAFVHLGTFLAQFTSPMDGQTQQKQSEVSELDTSVLHNESFYEEMQQILVAAHHENSWFTYDNLAFTCKNWSEALRKEQLTSWLSSYTFSEEDTPKTIAIVMAGNIPLVGFHDFLSVLISGNKVQAKLSSNDKKLVPFLASYLCAVAPKLSDFITFTEEKIEHFDAVIATGSTNTATYFEHYFGKYPHIIRKNRNAVAIITGTETPKEMEALADDVYRYFGLGCRNVSKIYIPEKYNLDHFFNGMYAWKEVINNHKYINNYDYNKAVYLMSNIKLFDNEFMLLKEDTGFSSPISVVFYERYKNIESVRKQLEDQKENIQCIVSQEDVPFGVAQTPKLWDYADGVDTLKFLISL